MNYRLVSRKQQPIERLTDSMFAKINGEILL